MREISKAELLQQYERKDVQMFTQYDGFVGHEPGLDSVMPADQDGDAMSGSLLHPELRTSGSDLAVRIQIHADAKASDVLRVLDKLRDWVRRDLEHAGDLTVGELRHLDELHHIAARDQFREHRKKWGLDGVPW